MGKKENTARRSMAGIRQQARQTIQQAAEAAAAVLDTVEFLGAYRKLHNAVRDQFTDYIYSLKGIDTWQGLPDSCTEETMEWISDRVTAMMEFLNSPKLQDMVRKYDPSKAGGEYPFFTYLESTLRLETKNLVSQQAAAEQGHGMTEIYQHRKTTVSANISRHIKSLLEVKPRVTYEDYEAIAEYFGVTVRDVEQVLQAENDVYRQTELNRTVGEDEEDELQDVLSYGSKTPGELLEEKEQDAFGSQWQALEQRFREDLTQTQQRIFACYATVRLIRWEMEQLRLKEAQKNSQIDSLAVLFRVEKELALQTLRNLKSMYTQRQSELICPEMFDLALEKQAVPTQKDMAELLQMTTANISKTYKQALEKLQ